MEASMKPHVLIFPLPLQSTVNSMMKLAELLCLSGINVTFLNTKYNQQRLTSNTNVVSRIKRYTTGLFQFETISDGLPDDHPRLVEHFPEIFNSLQAVAEPFFREKLKSSIRGEIEQPVTCVIAEGYHYYAIDVALDVGLPVYSFETISPCSLWAYLCLANLVQEGELPIAENELEKLVRNVPGMESFFRLRDLPVFCRGNFMDDPNYKLAVNDAGAVQRANGLIVNTFQDLDDPVLYQLKTKAENLYAIGPVHRHLQLRLAGSVTQDCSSNSFWKEDDSCLKWLSGKAQKSVMLVSFGSLARVTKDVLMEFWHGLVDSGVFFLWVIRLDSLLNQNLGDDSYLKQLQKGTEGRGRFIYFLVWPAS
ncbi:transferase [Lithospermum erythrorhizon]|uniref:Transferase n=1 Tax=Lithospermum erythrorhizon TaxID=34254 RepID=A0AAV3QVF0_LITER